MSLDSLTLYHLIRELSSQLIDARVDRIQQPEKDEIHLTLRPKVLSGQRFSGSVRLLLSASSTSARLHTVADPKKNPTTPPMFCMILRKHLEGARLLAIRQIDLDRIVTLVFQNYNERGDLQDYHLFLEIMGKHSNLILINPQNGTILDGIRRYSHAISRHREVLPGRIYVPPPAQLKVLPADETTWTESLLAQEVSLDLPMNRLLLQTLIGMSPELARELVARAGLPDDTTLNMCGQIELRRLYQVYAELLLGRNSYTLAPTLYYSSPNLQVPASAFSFAPYTQFDGYSVQSVSTLNEAVSRFYEGRFLSQKKESARGSLRHIVQDACAHSGKKVTIYQDTIDKAKRTLPTQKTGELIMANIYRIPPQATAITVEDYLQEQNDTDNKGSVMPLITIPLDPQLSPTENAQLYYRRYNKAKATLEKTQPLLVAVQSEYNYLQSLLVSIDLAQTPQELSEIRTELIEQKYLGKTWTSGKARDAGKATKVTKGKKQKTKSPAAEPPTRPHQYLSSTGHTIIVGRNNTQNDRMTWREARSHDLWLHVKNIPGSHVIIPLEEEQEFPDDTTLLEAAALAIHFSQAAGSSHVPVDYTHVAQIKKPKGAKPGMVIYDQNWSLYLTPDPAVIAGLLAREDVTSSR